MPRRNKPPQNTFLKKIEEKSVQRVILSMIDKGQLYTEDQLITMLEHNSLMTSYMLTIAMHHAFGIGKKRFEEKAQPIVQALSNDIDFWTNEVDADYAEGKLKQLYDKIME